MEINKNETFSIPLYAIFYCNKCNKIKFWKTVLKKEKNDNFMPMIWLAKSAVGCFIEIKIGLKRNVDEICHVTESQWSRVRCFVSTVVCGYRAGSLEFARGDSTTNRLPKNSHYDNNFKITIYPWYLKQIWPSYRYTWVRGYRQGANLGSSWTRVTSALINPFVKLWKTYICLYPQ